MAGSKLKVETLKVEDIWVVRRERDGWFWDLDDDWTPNILDAYQLDNETVALQEIRQFSGDGIPVRILGVMVTYGK